MRIRLTIEHRDYDQFAAQVGDVLPMLREVQQYLRQSRKYHTSRGIDPYGNPYKPLNPAYAARKLKRWGRKPILTASGDMVRGYSSEIRTDHEARLIESYPYPAAEHQEGIGIMPQRLLFPTAAAGLPVSNKKRFRRIAFDHVERASTGLRTVATRINL